MITRKELIRKSTYRSTHYFYKNSCYSYKNTYYKNRRASLVAQWLRIRLPIQGTRVRALVWDDPTCCGATEPVSHNY